MNKKQEALRRGLRSFIEDASRELADLEGRELPPRHRGVVEEAVMPPVPDESPPPAAQDAAVAPSPPDDTLAAGRDAAAAAPPRVAAPASAAQNATTAPSSRESALRPDAPDTAAVPSSQDATHRPSTRGTVIVPPSSEDAALPPAARDSVIGTSSQDAALPPAARGTVIVPSSQGATLPSATRGTVIVPPSSQDATLPTVPRDPSTAPLRPDAAQPLFAPGPAASLPVVSEPSLEVPSPRGGAAADPGDDAQTSETAPPGPAQQLEPMQAVPPALDAGVAAPTQAESTLRRGAEVHGKGGQGTSRGERRKRPRARPRQRAAPSIGVDGMGMLNVRSKKGVCSAYFINEQCWQIPEAYCNTALQVCIMRECPVYHLHKEALERRFARKFKHLW